MGGGYVGPARPINRQTGGFNEAAARGRRIHVRSEVAQHQVHASMRPPPVGGGYATTSQSTQVVDSTLQ